MSMTNTVYVVVAFHTKFPEKQDVLDQEFTSFLDKQTQIDICEISVTSKLVLVNLYSNKGFILFS